MAIEVDPELDEDVPHYEVELSQSGHDEREYWVDAFTGEILIGDPAILPPSSPAEHEQSAPENSSSVGIGPEQARNIALTHAGVSESQVSGLQIQHDQDDGHLEYEVEFCTGSMEYEYTIDGSTGKILKYDCEQDD